MLVDGDKGADIAKYTGSTTGTSRDNNICSRYTPITWQVDRKCHMISASSFDKLCADMKKIKTDGGDDMKDDLYPHGARTLVATHLTANAAPLLGGRSGGGPPSCPPYAGGGGSGPGSVGGRVVVAGSRAGSRAGSGSVRSGHGSGRGSFTLLYVSWVFYDDDEDEDGEAEGDFFSRDTALLVEVGRDSSSIAFSSYLASFSYIVVK